AEIAPPKGFQTIQAPVNVPVEIPKIDLSAKITDEADFSGKGVKGGSASGTAGSEGTKEGAPAGVAVNTDRTYTEFEVEEHVTPISGTNPSYPESMRSSGAEGEVHAQFVVNENGRAEPGTFKVLNSPNAAFTQAVKDALPRMRFRPAKIGKTSVSQLVQQAFVFKLDKSYPRAGPPCGQHTHEAAERRAFGGKLPRMLFVLFSAHSRSLEQQ